MHEMSIAASLIGIIKEEMEKNNAEKLLLIRVKYGRLSNLVPEALDFAFEVSTQGTNMEGAKLEMVEVPFRAKCHKCGTEFEPEGDNVFFMPCPACNEEFGHEILSGREMFLDYLEAE